MASELRVDKIIPTDGVPTGGGGGIIQIVQTTKTDTFTTTSAGVQDITGLSVNITPKFATSKFLVRVNISGMANNSGNGILINGTTTGSLLEPSGYGSRGRSAGSEFYDARSDTYRTLSAEVLDSPGTTSTQTYKAQVFVRNNGNTIYINRSSDDGDNSGKSRGCSTITVMEVSA